MKFRVADEVEVDSTMIYVEEIEGLIGDIISIHSSNEKPITVRFGRDIYSFEASELILHHTTPPVLTRNKDGFMEGDEVVVTIDATNRETYKEYNIPKHFISTITKIEDSEYLIDSIPVLGFADDFWTDPEEIRLATTMDKVLYGAKNEI